MNASAPTIGAVAATASRSCDTGGSRSVIISSLVGAAALVAGAVLIGGTPAGVGLLAVAVMAVTAIRPAVAVYVYMGTLPFLAGLERGGAIPLVRPNEAILVLVLSGVLVGSYMRFVRGDEVRLHLRPIDVSLGVFVLMSTAWPVLWLLLRGRTPTGGELAALLPVIKLIGLLILVRATVRTDNQTLRLGRFVIWPGAAIAVIAVLQTAGLAPLNVLLARYWGAAGGDGVPTADRGTTTFSSSIATGDYIVLALALLVALTVRGLIGRRESLSLGLLLGAGVFAAGQFSTWAAALVVTTVLLRRYPHLRRRAVRSLPLLGLAALIGAPAFVLRLTEFAGEFGVPRSWLGRWDNLVNFYLPGLGDFAFVLGVSPNSVLPAPETWRTVIYLEYGYLQLLWVGGIPLLLAFIWLTIDILRCSRALVGDRSVTGAFATTLYAAWWMVLLLSIIDIHLVLRGAGEILFVLLAITSRQDVGQRRGPAPVSSQDRRDTEAVVPEADTPEVLRAGRSTDGHAPRR